MRLVDRQIAGRVVGIVAAEAVCRGARGDGGAGDAPLVRRLKHVERALDVGLEIGLGRRRHGVVDGGQVDHRVVARQGAVHRVEVEHVYGDKGVRRPARLDVEHADGGVAGDLVDHEAPQPPAPSGHRDPLGPHA